MTTFSCPDCQAALVPGQDVCPQCDLPLTGPSAHELWLVDRELAFLAARRNGLLARRATLVDQLRALRAAGPLAAQVPQGMQIPQDMQVPQGAQGGRFAGAGWPAPQGPVPGGYAPAPRAREMRSLSVQNLLLLLGGLLVGIAAIVFTVVSWGSLGIGGRAAVLTGVTACALALPWPLLHRNLRATAETAANIGLVLITLDAYAAYHLGLVGHPDPFGYVSAVSLLTAVGWTAYGIVTGLRSPRPTAAVIAWLPLPPATLALDIDFSFTIAAFLTTAALDLLLARRAPEALRTKAWIIGMFVNGAIGLLLSLLQAVGTEEVPHAIGASVLLAAAGALGLTYAWRAAAVPAQIITVISALTLTAALAEVPATAIGGWWLVVPVAGAAAVTALAASALPVRLRTAAQIASGAVLAVTVVFVAVGGLLRTLVAPLGDLRHAGHGVPSTIHAAMPGGHLPPVAEPAPVVLAIAALTAFLVALLGTRVQPGPAAPAPGNAPGEERTVSVPQALRLLAGALAGLAVVAVPGALDLPYVAEVWMLVAVAAVALGFAVWRTPWALAVAGGATPPAVAWALAGRWLTVGTCGTLLVLYVGTALAARREPVRMPTAPVAVVLAVSTACTLPWAADWPRWTASLLVFAVAAAVAAITAKPRGTLSIVLEATFIPVIVLAVVLAADDTWSLAMITGLVALGSALWAVARDGDRRSAGAALTTFALGVAALNTVLAAGQPLKVAAFALLAVAALSAAVTALLARRATAGGAGSPLTVDQAVEFPGYLLALGAVLLTGRDTDLLSLSLSLTGALAMAVALRPDRRRAASLTGVALFQLAAWIRLVMADVTTPEAYTAGVSAIALTLGWLRRRTDRTASSWLAYGPGLTLTLVPSLVATWSDPNWVRPLLLGLATTALVLAGARARLKAPLILGGAFLVLDAAHELAPEVTQFLSYLPRWAPIAVIGLVLLLLGTTYERRLRDLRRARAAYARLT